MRGAKPYLGHVFLASVSILSYEILLTRIFAVSQWNHLVFLVISIALFGFAASGTFFSVLSAGPARRARPGSGHLWASMLCSLQAAATIGSYAGLNALPLDYFRLALEPAQLAYLMAAYLMLACPFFIAGLVVSTAFAARPQKSGAIYFATMTGSAGGALLPIWLTPALGEPVAVLLCALLPIAVQPLYYRAERALPGTGSSGRRSATIPLILSAIVIIPTGFLLSPAGSRYIRIRSSDYKGLEQTLRFPQTRVTASYRRLQGHIDRVKGPYLRYAPGLSLNFTDRLPSQQVVFSDRDVPMTLYDPEKSQLVFARETLSYAAYVQVPAVRRVLVIPQNGGLSLACALASGAADIRAAIPHPDLADIVENHYDIKVATDHPRAFTARSPGRFDIIQVENWGSTIPGADALTQNHTLTVDAFEAYLELLTPGGAVTVSRRLMLPPSDSLRLWATAHDALSRRGISDPRRHIAMLRNWDTYTLVLTRQPMNNGDALLEFAARYGFDLVFSPWPTAQQPNRFNQLPQPYYHRRIGRLAEAYRQGRSGPYLAAYPLDIAPQTDWRPFPGRRLKWTHAWDLYRSTGSRYYSLFLSGEVVVVVVLAEALLVTLLLLAVPRRLMRNAGARAGIRQILYFFGIGCGFMFLEIYFIHLCTFLLGDPVIGFSIVVTGLLIFSGLGGLVSRMWRLRAVRIVLPLLTVLIAALLSGRIWGLDRLLELSVPVRFILLLLALMPFGVLVGMPFPVGMRLIASGPAASAYAWSINGCASVLTAVLAAQLAISFGLEFLLIGAVAAYWLSFAGSFGHRTSHSG